MGSQIQSRIINYQKEPAEIKYGILVLKFLFLELENLQFSLDGYVSGYPVKLHGLGTMSIDNENIFSVTFAEQWNCTIPHHKRWQNWKAHSIFIGTGMRGGSWIVTEIRFLGF